MTSALSWQNSISLCPASFHTLRPNLPVECKSRKSRNTCSNRQIGLGVQNEAGQRLIEFCQRNTLVRANTLYQKHKKDSTHEHHQMVNSKIILIIFFAAKDGEALNSQQKQDWELTVAQIMNSLLANSD